MTAARDRWNTAVIGLIVVMVLAAGAPAPAGAQTPAQVGEWEGPLPWPLVSIHMMLTPNGRVLAFDGPPADGGLSARLWNPANGQFSAVPNNVTNLFCVGQAFLGDGRAFLAGGHLAAGVGLVDGNIFDPVTRSWSLTAPMAFPRWYPTVTTLPDGRMLVNSGSDTCEQCIVSTPEIYDPRTNTWTQLTNANLTLPLYPHIFVLPDGRVLASGTVVQPIPTRVLNLATQTWTTVDSRLIDGHSAVMYRPGKILKSGSAADVGVSTAPSSRNAFVLDMTVGSPSWQATGQMVQPRAFHNLTVLPDGTVLATGGGFAVDGVDSANAVFQAEVWSPTTGTWTGLASAQTPRLYHSTALLLPDGRVLVSGSGRFGPEPQFSAEIYSPPYLFKGARPTVTSVPPAATYNRTIFVGTPNASQIASVSLVGIGAVTHAFDAGQRYLSLSFSQTTGGLNVQTPANHNLAPPGYYMLFVVNSAGVPSVADMVLIGEDSDNDGLPDAWEVRYFGNLSQGPNGDPDGDGLTNLQELAAGTSPTLADSDGDGFSDGAEVAAGSDPLDPSSTLPALATTPSGLIFRGIIGDTPPSPQTVTVFNSGPGTLNWTATSSQPWLTLAPTSGSTPASFTATVSTTGLAAGVHEATITLTAPGATNSPHAVPVALELSAAGQPIRIPFIYVDRDELVSDGWDFIARRADGTGRDTELTAGHPVDYNQTTHPNVIRIVSEQGDIWANGNDSRNTLFRDLPANWNSIRLKIAAFAPTEVYQGACLLAYQDDDNYAAICRDFVNAQIVEWWQETGGNPAIVGNLSNSATSNVILRLDRNGGTDTLTAFVSVNDGATWTQLAGSAVRPLTVPRLGILVGANVSQSSPAADLAWVEIATSGSLPTSIVVSPTSLSFGAIPGGPNPPSQTVSITNGGGGTLTWTATTNQPWLSVSPTSGSAPLSMTVNVNSTGLALGTYNGTITLTSSQATNSPKTIPVTLTVAQPTLAASPTTMTFNAVQGAANPPSQSISITNGGGGTLTWTATTNQPWLSVAPGSGTAPSSASVSVATTSLALGTYNGTVTITSPQANNSPRTVAVTLNVTPPPPVLSVSPSSLAFSAVTGTNPPSQTLSISNTGAGTLSWTVSDNQTWLSVSPASGTGNASVTVSVASSALAAGNYSGTITITASGAVNSPTTVAVALTVSAPPTLSVSPSSLGFTGQQGGSNPAAQAIAVTNPGTGTLNWTASDNQPWLSLSPTSGTGNGSITATVSTAGLAAGTYTATITVTSPGAVNSPRTVAVTLTVTPQPNLGVSPTSLTFNGAQGAANPASQNVSITNSGGGALAWTASKNQPWLTLGQTSGVAPSTLVVKVASSGLAAGTYTGSVTVTASGALGSPKTVGVTFNVAPPAPQLRLSPVSLAFGALQGGANPAAQSVSITNLAAGVLSWSVSSNQSWLTASPGTGNTPGSISVNVASSSLAPGTYAGALTVTSAGAANSPQTIPVSLVVVSSAAGGQVNFTYPNRAALLADGWDFIARTSSGGQRNTEQTSGQVVDYDQTAHPGVLRIPVDAGSTWASSNDTRNTLFRDLPADWQSIRVRLATFAPTGNYQSACLLAYQHDDNHVIVCREFVNGHFFEWWNETSGSPAVLGNLASTATANIVLRLDRNPTSNLITAFVSVDGGSSWTQLPGSVTKSLVNPRLGIFIGGNVLGGTPTSDVASVEVVAAPAFVTNPASLSAAGSTGGPNPGSQTLVLTSTSSTALSWTASVNQPWVTIGPASGSSPSVVTVNFSTAGLAAGTYSANLTLTSAQATNSPKVVPITLTVAAAALTATPAALSFEASDGGAAPAPQTVTVGNAAGGPLNWTATVDQPWLAINPASGTSPTPVTVTVTSAGLAAGVHSATISVASLQATNSPLTIPVTVDVSPPIQLTHIDFTYANRSALLAGGWDFSARTAGGAGRDTEQTTGYVVDYNQSTHPGVIRIPTDAGTPWAGNNNTRNTLFRDIPSDWRSLRLKLAAFAPSGVYQSACLMAYQHDDNHAILCREFVSGQLFEWWHEGASGPVVLGSTAATATGNMVLRLDRNPDTNLITAFVSIDGGASWTQLAGSVVKPMSSPRLGIFVGGNASGSVPNADLAFVEVIAQVTTLPTPTLALSPAKLTFTGISGGANPASQTIGVTNPGPGTITWSASDNQPWLSVSPASGSTPGGLAVNVSTSGLAAGIYNGTVTVTSSQASNSPQTVPVTLNVVSLAAHRILTTAVLVNGANAAGYNPNPATPGEYQRYPERYLEHLQVPYEVIDVSTTPPPVDILDRQLIVAGHRGLNLSGAWQDAIANAVQAGSGFVNLDWDPTVGTQSHIQRVFGVSGSEAGTPGEAITVPATIVAGGLAPHYIAGLQRRFLGDPSGDLVYFFHADENNVQQSAQSTTLVGSTGTVIARIGSDPLIVATSYGAGRAVHVGTLEYLKADRFGFLQGVDDLFWRSLVWAARKPFVVRGYPRLWSVQMDDTQDGWAARVRDLYTTAFTGTLNPDGTGGPWKVTGYVYTDNMAPGGPERASVISDISAGHLEVSPHSFAGAAFGDTYWNQDNGPLTDAQWLSNLNEVLAWAQGQGGADVVPFSRSMVAHYWDLSNNTGWDMWNQLGFRYVTSIQKPGFQRLTDYGGQERPSARPFWNYEKPPKRTADEEPNSFFFADDLVVGSRSGQPSQTMFLFTTQVHGIDSPRVDVTWPAELTSANVPWSVSESVDQFQRYTWRLWSSFAPVQIFTHDSANYEFSTVQDRQAVISQVSTWLTGQGVRHSFMDDLGDYIYARTKSQLTRGELAGGNITYSFSGNSATAVGALIPTEVRLYLGDTEGTTATMSGFIGGQLITQPVGGP